MDLLAPHSATTLALLGFRIGGVVLIAPVFSSRLVPTMLKSSLVVVFVWLLHPVAMASVAAGVGLTPERALAESMVGMAIGLGAAILIGAAEAAGDLLAIQIGLSGASALDPLTMHSVPVLGQFANLFAVTLMLSVDGHLVMLEAIAASLRLLPIGGELRLAEGAAAMVAMGSTLFVLGVRFAAPVLATVLLANVALGVLTRAAPSLNVLSVAFPLQIGVGLFALAASIPAIGTFYLGWDQVYEEMVMRVFAVLSAGGGR